jgi:octopine/nopaline transport system permease protein
MLDLALIAETLPKLMDGIGLTLSLVVLSQLGGFALGAVICWAQLSPNRFARTAAQAYVTFFRGTPALVQLFVIYFGLAQFEWVRASPLWIVLRDPFWCCVVAFSMNSGAYIAEIMRGALSGVPEALKETGRALGMRDGTIFRTITAPLAMRLFLPPYGNELISMLKTTALASTVTLSDLTGVARTVVAQTYAPYEIFISAALIYLALAWLIGAGVAAAERRAGAWDRHSH